MAQLKEQLNIRGLSTKGLKAVLFARLSEAVAAADEEQKDVATEALLVISEETGEEKSSQESGGSSAAVIRIADPSSYLESSQSEEDKSINASEPEKPMEDGEIEDDSDAEHKVGSSLDTETENKLKDHAKSVVRVFFSKLKEILKAKVVKGGF